MRLDGEVKKGWGSEQIWATNDLYCGKLLRFNEGKKFSMHLHKEKDETWLVMSGKFKLTVILTETAERTEIFLESGETWRNPPMIPHQLECLEQGVVIEVSTPDSVEDNYRVEPGDSQ